MTRRAGEVEIDSLDRRAPAFGGAEAPVDVQLSEYARGFDRILESREKI
jgi:hypothetical protein